MPGLPALDKIRAALYAAQNGVCPYCAEAMPDPDTRNDVGRRVVTLDHVFPRARDRWRGHVGNLLLAHQPCNRIKDDRMPTPCEVLFLIAVNDRLGVRLRLFDGDNPPPNHNQRVRSPEERAEQSARDKAAARERKLGRQAATLGEVWPPTRAQLQAGHPALGALDDAIEGLRTLYRKGSF